MFRTRRCLVIYSSNISQIQPFSNFFSAAGFIIITINKRKQLFYLSYKLKDFILIIDSETLPRLTLSDCSQIKLMSNTYNILLKSKEGLINFRPFIVDIYFLKPFLLADLKAYIFNKLTTDPLKENNQRYNYSLTINTNNNFPILGYKSVFLTEEEFKTFIFLINNKRFSYLPCFKNLTKRDIFDKLYLINKNTRKVHSSSLKKKLIQCFEEEETYQRFLNSLFQKN